LAELFFFCQLAQFQTIFSTFLFDNPERLLNLIHVRRALGDQVDVQLASHRLFEVLHILKFLLTRDQDHRLLA
jgi:hypothetical protein